MKDQLTPQSAPPSLPARRTLVVTFAAVESASVPIPANYPTDTELWSDEQRQYLLNKAYELVKDDGACWECDDYTVQYSTAPYNDHHTTGKLNNGIT